MPWAGGNQGREAVAVSGDGVDSTMWGPERSHFWWIFMDVIQHFSLHVEACVYIYIYEPNGQLIKFISVFL